MFFVMLKNKTAVVLPALMNSHCLPFCNSEVLYGTVTSDNVVQHICFVCQASPCWSFSSGRADGVLWWLVNTNPAPAGTRDGPKRAVGHLQGWRNMEHARGAPTSRAETGGKPRWTFVPVGGVMLPACPWHLAGWLAARMCSPSCHLPGGKGDRLLSSCRWWHHAGKHSGLPSWRDAGLPLQHAG